MTIAPMKTTRTGLPLGVRNQTPKGTINSQERNTTQPCHARGKPQPKP